VGRDKFQKIVNLMEKKLQDLQIKMKLLEEENSYLKFQIKELQSKIYKKKHPKNDPPAGEDEPEKPKKKRGAPVGHKGWFRKKPEKIDKVEERLSTLQTELETLVGNLSSPRKPSIIPRTPPISGGGPSVIVRCKQWDDFKTFFNKDRFDLFKINIFLRHKERGRVISLFNSTGQVLYP